MKNWICYNLLGEKPQDVGMCGMLLALGMVGFLLCCWVYLFIYVPFFCI